LDPTNAPSKLSDPRSGWIPESKNFYQIKKDRHRPIYIVHTPLQALFVYPLPSPSLPSDNPPSHLLEPEKETRRLGQFGKSLAIDWQKR
ncbi:uncharacterized protein PgNI_04430, partial [Pyricularia grisea]|uniref:Uncharacterized protein n=1 Tax=Pyricularia grisea TaxID=148305 RepID=A0A6P8BEK4_PYRGI